jgi:L-malate glycosyltransferase
LIEAVKRLEDDVSVLIMGNGDEQYLAELKILAKENNRIQFRAYKQNPRDEINVVDIVVLPSIEREGLSRIIIEAMALGKIVIASDSPENLEALGYDLKEFSFKNNDAQDLSRVVTKIKNNRALQQSIGLIARKRAENFFDAVKNTRLIEAVYYSILGKSDAKNKRFN